MLRATVYMHETPDTAIGNENFFEEMVKEVKWKMEDGINKQ